MRSGMPFDTFNPYDSRLRKIFLRKHEVWINIGIHDFELTKPQRVWIDVDLFVLYESTQPRADKIHEVVDYDFIREVVAKRIRDRHIALQETLVDELVSDILAHPGVIGARVATSKPDVYPDCESIGVEVFRFKTL
jgi:dihydroneopterin aldolase